MKDLTNNRIYAQLQPDSSGLAGLRRVQQGLDVQKSGRMIGADELHMTLLHFGKVPDARERLSRVEEFDDSKFLHALDDYVARTEYLLTNIEVTLTFDEYALFGRNSTTLVARFKPHQSLSTLHAELVAVLVQFFEELGIKNPEKFMTHDENFMHAFEFTPHVTLYKGYFGDAPTTTLPDTHFKAMKVVY